MALGSGLAGNGGASSTLSTSGGSTLPGWMATPTAPPALAGWTWRNQGVATASDDSDGLFLAIPASTGTAIRGLTRALGARPYTITAAFAWLVGLGNANQEAGIFIHDSIGGKAQTIAIWQPNEILSYQWSTLSSPQNAGFSSNARCYDIMWLQIKDDGTNLLLQISPDGRHWTTLNTTTSQSYLTPDSAGVFVDGQGLAQPVWLKLLSWAIT